MTKPALVIMAAGMGSRYGGLKQIDPVGAHGELIIDYSVYDAKRAGFEKVVFIIKKEIEADFKAVVSRGIAKQMEVTYAFQELDQLPAGYSVPEGRVKPWGTTHAILAAQNVVDGRFAVINADDYYGPAAYSTLYDWLVEPHPEDCKHHFSMVVYPVENTLSASGGVTRGVCEAKNGYLTSIAERKMVEKTDAGARWSPDDGMNWNELPRGTLVSMNIWGLTEGFMQEAEQGFSTFLDENLSKNPRKCEYLLPEKINDMLQAGQVDVRVLQSGDTWYGVTYKEDKPIVQRVMAQKQESGLYPVPLWKS